MKRSTICFLLAITFLLAGCRGAPFPISDHRETPPSVFRVMTWNVHLFGAMTLGFGGVVVADNRRARLIGELLGDLRRQGLDVVALQEVWDDRYAEWLQKESGYPYSFYGNARDLRPNAPNSILGSGLLILSAWPLEQTKQFVYPALPGVDALTSKGFLLCEVQKEGAPITLVTTHFHTSGGSGTDARRREHLAMINRAIEQGPGEDTGSLSIIAGDFNTARESPSDYETMMGILQGRTEPLIDAALMARDPTSDEGPTAVSWNTLRRYVGGTKNSTIDHIFLRRHAGAPTLRPVESRVHRFLLPDGEPPLARYHDKAWGQTDVIDLSDHLAVEVTFTSPRRAPTL